MKRHFSVPALLVCTFLIPLAAWAQPATFASPAHLGVGLSPVEIAIADFNFDGTPDLAVVNQATDNVSTFLGNTSGGFTAAPGSPLAVGSSPSGIVIADVNGDGIPDLAVANQASVTISILAGSGDGSFSPFADIPLAGGSLPSAIAAGDFNSDFNLDLAVADGGANGVFILLGDGLGGFTPASGSPVAAGSTPAGLVVGTFNGDSALDLAVTNSAGVKVLFGDGGGGFASAGDYAALAPLGIVAADLNGNGTIDLATADTGGNSVSVLLGDGAGGFSFASGSPFAVGSAPTRIVAGDVNGDGSVDAVVTNSGSNTVSVLLGDGTGGFSAPASLAAGLLPTALGSGDFNGDRKLDIVVVNRGENNAGVYLNTTCCFLTVTNFGAPLNLVTSSPSRISCGLDCFRAFAPGTPVTLTATPASGFELQGWSGACTGTSTCDVTMNSDVSVTATFGFTINPPTLPSGTVTTPYTQALTPAGSSGPFTFLLQSGSTPPGITLSTGGILSGTPVQTGSFAFTVTAFDEEGYSGSRAYSITIVPNPLTISSIPTITTGRNTPVTVTFTIADTAASVFAVSVTGLSSDETIVPNTGLVFGGMGTYRSLTITPAADQLGTATITITAEDGSFTASTAFQLVVPANAPPSIVAPAHASTRRNTPRVVPFTVGDAESGAAAVTVTATSSNTTLVPTANLQVGGSGASRTLTITPAANQIGTATITLTASDGTLSATSALVVLVSASVAGDLDGDRKADFTIYRPWDGNWWTDLSNGTYTTFLNVPWGNSADVSVPGDFDGDGKDDYAIYRRSTGEWWVLKSSTNFMTYGGYNTYDVYNWGGFSDTPVSGDFDGDGRADVTVYRPPTGQWYIRLPGVNPAGHVVINWGASIDVPVVADYDGDGTSDVAVYRPTTGMWFVLTSSSNFSMYFALAWGGGAGDVASPGDYDGDGRADLAVFRPSTGQWFVLFSRTNYATYYVTEWGMAGDISTPGDFDGDGVTDFALYRPSTGAWNVLTSTSAFTTALVVNWGVAGDLPLLRRP